MIAGRLYFIFVLKSIQPMKTARLFVFLTAFFCCVHALQAQPSSPSESAIVFADSFLKSFRDNDLEQYANLSYPGVISYYGGNKNFREYIQRARTLNRSGASESLEVIQVVHDLTELQCVIKKTSGTTIDGRKAQVISYMIGQSKDEGQTWKFVDVAQNSSANLVFIMPDISAKLDIPRREIIFENTGS